MTVKTLSKSAAFHFCDCGDTVRVWLDTWGGDQFEVMTLVEFDEFQKLLAPFSFSFVDHTGD